MTPSLDSQVLALDPLARTALLVDGALAIALGLCGLFTGRLQAEWTELPAALVLVASTALLPYGARAWEAGRAGRASRARTSGLCLLNACWVVVVIALPIGGWIDPNAVGWMLLAAHLAVPLVMTLVLWRSLRFIERPSAAGRER
ncbi:MAG: hypothetical protein MUE69_25530 [Myxococcota bacterium]|nr:hypothetical protein [Myxococcota bacterium]